jgi:hypothetical protein
VVHTHNAYVFSFHYDTVWQYNTILSDICSIQHHCVESDRRILSNNNLVQFQNSIFKRVSLRKNNKFTIKSHHFSYLKLSGNCRIIFENQHIGIDQLREAMAEKHVATNGDAHHTQIPIQQQCAFEERHWHARHCIPNGVVEIPTIDPSRP